MGQNANVRTNGLWWQCCFDVSRKNATGKQHLGVALQQPVPVSCLAMVKVKKIIPRWSILD